MGYHGLFEHGDTVGLDRKKMSDEKLEHRVNHIGLDHADAEGRLQNGFFILPTTQGAARLRRSKCSGVEATRRVEEWSG
jgi:hypothetical protein